MAGFAVNTREWKTTAQAAGELGVSETTIWRWALKYGANFDPGDGLEISARMVDLRILRKLRPTTV
jgi:hypothetical protein